MQMRFNIVLVLLLGASTGVNSSSISRATATNCTVGKGGESKCRLNVNDLILGVAPVIQLTVKQGERTITCTRGQRGEALGSWYGDCDGDAGEVNFVTVDDDRGSTMIFGSIPVGSNMCQITSTSETETEIKCAPPIRVSLREIPEGRKPQLFRDGDRKLQFGFTPSTTQTLRTTGRNRRLYDDSGSTVDVMMVWSAAAECKTSSLGFPCVFTSATELKMLGQLNLAIASSNTAFAESGVSMQLRLVHAYRHPTYVEPTAADAWVDFHALENMKDNDVRAKRALYGADMVAFIYGTPASSYCSGVAWTPSFAGSIASFKDNMYSSTGHNCLLRGSNDVLTHELAHLFGCQHDRGTAQACSSNLDQHNFGYRDPAGEFKSIMGYQYTLENDGVTKQCDNIAGGPFIWHSANRFSNPNILYRGKAIGSQRENNARYLNERKAAVAALFPAMNCITDSECNDGDATTIDTCNLLNAACVFSPKALPAPTRSPVKPPTKGPTMAPTLAPIKLSTNAPVKPPSRSPIKPTTKAPTKEPTSAPLKPPTKAPSNVPTRSPIKPPTKQPTKSPTLAPLTPLTKAPTKAPTYSPINPPTRSPTRSPINQPPSAPLKPPSKAPVKVPTKSPAKVPTKSPVKSPTKAPQKAPTKSPRRTPTRAPKRTPTKSPTRVPRKSPTKAPRKPPTRAPVKPPTKSPTKVPTRVPTLAPATSEPTVEATLAPATSEPTLAPTKSPTTAPVNLPTKAPVRPLTKGPVRFLTKAPVRPPTKGPVRFLTKAPVRPSTKTPVKAPTKSPIKPTTKAPASVPSNYNIQLGLSGISSIADQAVFVTAMSKWQSVITGDLSSYPAAQYLPPRDDGCRWPTVIDDLFICASYASIDGPSGILGYAYPEYVRIPSNLPLSGVMVFDSNDVASLKAKGGTRFLNTILHEVGHILGVGTLWGGETTAKSAPQCDYVGSNANREYTAISGCSAVPVERDGGKGTMCGHWDEECMANELMTGYLESDGPNPLSRITVGALEDQGYQVAYNKSDVFTRSNLAPQCTCSGKRRRTRGRFLKDMAHGDIISFGSAQNKRPRRRLSDEAQAEAIQAGLTLLSTHAEEHFNGELSKLAYVGAQVVSVMIEDGGEFYGVVVRKTE